MQNPDGACVVHGASRLGFAHAGLSMGVIGLESLSSTTPRQKGNLISRFFSCQPLLLNILGLPIDRKEVVSAQETVGVWSQTRHIPRPNRSSTS